MDIRPIRTESDYECALKRIEALMDARAGSAEGDELEVLSLLVEAWERKHHGIEAPGPVEFIRNVMDFVGAGQKELAEILSSRSRASEVLNRRRPLTLEQIRLISEAWQVPSDPLIQRYEVR